MSDLEIKKIFGKNLTRFLNERNESQAELAKIMKVAPSSVSGWCSGIKMPRMDKLDFLAKHFQVTRADLIESQPDHANIVSDKTLKAAFFAGYDKLSESDIDELWEDARAYAQFKAYQKLKKKDTDT